MSTTTPNLKLTIQGIDENYDVNIVNENFNKIDALELVDTKIKITDKNNNFTSETLDGALDEVFQRGVNVKTMFASTITAKGIPTSKEDTFEQINENITKLPDKNYVYGFRIDKNNSNPATKVTYIKDAVGIAPATPNSYGGWANRFIFDRVKPCGFKSGKKTQYINENDFTKYVDGSTVPADVDVMIEFPKFYWKWTQTDTYIDVELSEHKIDEGFECLAHSIGEAEKNNIYIGAYLGYEENGKLRSKKGVLPTVSKTISQFRTLAQANGEGYQQFIYYAMFMLQMLFVLMYKNTDSQSSLGMGYTSKENTSSIATGATYNKGMFYGETLGKEQMKFLGIEDLWGNLNQWVDGFYCDDKRNLLISDNSVFNDSGSGYKNHGQGSSSDLASGYINTIQGRQNIGFIPKEVNGSLSINYCDYGSLYAGGLMNVGGSWNSNTIAGIFRCHVNYDAPSFFDYLGSRLVYL